MEDESLLQHDADSLLFFELSQKTVETLKVYAEIENGDFPGEVRHLEEIKNVVDVPMLGSILLNAIDEVEVSLKLAVILAKKYGLEKLRDRLQSIEEAK